MVFKDVVRESEMQDVITESNKSDDLLHSLEHVLKEPMDDSTLLSMTDSSQDHIINTPKSIHKENMKPKRVSKIQRPRVFRKQISSIASTSLRTLYDVHSRSNDRFCGLEESLAQHQPSSNRNEFKMTKGSKSMYNMSILAPEKNQHLLIKMKSQSYNERCDPSISFEQLVSQFHQLQMLQRDKDRLQVTDNAEGNMELRDIFSPPSIIEFQNITSVFVQNRYENDGEYFQIDSKETGLHDFLVKYRENNMSAKELAQEIMHNLFRQNLSKDVQWKMGDTLSREIALPLGEKGYSIFIEAREVSTSEAICTSSVTGNVIFVFDCNEIQIENYSFLSTSEPTD